jgi:hypothetical protein
MGRPLSGLPKRCAKCKVVLPDKYQTWQTAVPYCKACGTVYARELRRRDPEKARTRERKYELRRRYGIEAADYDRLLKKQRGRCAICRSPEPGSAGSKPWKYFAVDHCHLTSKVRGLLCANCNRVLGIAKDSSRLLRKAAEYLEKVV